MSKAEEKIMLTTGAANVDSSVNVLIEEQLQDMDFNDQLDDNFNEDGDDDPKLIVPLNGPNEVDSENELNNSELPFEIRSYVKTLESQSAQLEKELLLCDEFLTDSLHQEKVTSNAVMPYDDVKLLADAAAEAGMTIEEFKQKVLKDLESDDFNEEMMDREFEEFTQMQKELADITTDIHEAMYKNEENELLAIEASCDENVNNVNDSTGEINSSLALRYLREHRLAISDTEHKAGPLVSMAALSDLRNFIHEQLRKTEESFHTRQQNLVESIERHKQEEEKRMLVEEKRKNKLKLEQEDEEAALREREKDKQGKLEEELKVLEDQLAQELNFHQAEIDKLSHDLEVEKTWYETEHSHWLKSLEATRSHAALEIQRRYRGYRTRSKMSAMIKDLAELKTLRKNERYKLRVLEVEYQMKYMAEQDRKKKEEEAKKEAEEKKKQEEVERQKEADLRRREEENRLAEEARKEAERKKEEKRLEEERKKEEERRLREEEKLRKQEEKNRIEEEKRRQKEEEKQRKLEEKRKKEEEKKLKEEAEKKRKEEEKKRELEEHKKKEEAMRNKIELIVVTNTSPSESQPFQDGGTEIQAFLKASQQAGDGVLRQDETNPDKPHIQGTHQLPAATPTMANHSPRPPDHPPTHSFSTSSTAKTASASPHPPPPPPQSIPPAPPLAEQQHTPHPAELQRLAWIKSCIPWSKVSNEPWKLVQSGQKIHKRPVSAKKKLPAIAESVVLTAAHAETLRQVSSVTLYDLPGCSLSTLGQCWSLRYLTVSHCHLVCLDGISQCKHLHYVNAEHNNIEYVDLKDLGSLQVARLAKNKVGAIHGLDGCVNLRWLDVSHNNITRLSGLSALRRLHTLNISYNQLVGCEGVEEAVTLQHLDLSHNFLQHFTGIDKLCLLTWLDLSSNNLLEVPQLKNQVLLQVLQLQKNSIKSLAVFRESWLPLLCRLNCSENMLESVAGLEHMILLRHLDISHNQITELDSLSQGLQYNKQLQNLDIEGNPVVEVYSNDYKNHLSESLRSLKVLNGIELKREGAETLPIDNCLDLEFLQMCSDQIHLHDTLRQDFENQKMALQSASQTTIESICHSHFSYCDLSFKMAAEHRSTHEYGYIETYGNLNKFISPTLSSTKDLNKLDKSREHHESMLKKNQDSAVQKASDTMVSSTISKLTTGSEKKKGDPSEELSGNKSLNRQNGSHKNSKQGKVSTSGKTDVSGMKQDSIAMETSDSLSEFSDEDVADNLARGVVKPYLVPRPPRAPAKALHVSLKDKFNKVFQENVSLTSDFSRKVTVETSLNVLKEEENFNSNCSMVDSDVMESKPQPSIPGQLGGLGQYISEKDKFEMALQNQNQPESWQSGTSGQGQAKVMSHQSGTAYKNGHMTLHGVKADIIASKMSEVVTDDMFMEFNMDDMDMEALDFDIDKYLEMGELDEFLESGWRPADEPQLPQSSYPVLRNIPQNGHIPRGSDQVSGPPGQPSQAWDVNLVTEVRGNNSFPFSGHGVVPPLAQPSPTPSTVASAAETIEGGSVRSKVDEIIEDWGFKDARTAELMLARAKKMKYNTERKRKLSKLDPRQRLQLFRKLEESGKILSVRPPNVKTLPRKEYFQAREEETQRKEMERQVEDNNRVGRTFEWIHTQVGDYPVSSSRINPGSAALTTNTNDVLGNLSDPRKTSPMSDHRSSAASRAGLHQVRRLSLGNDYSGQSPSLPPIFKKDRLSFRDTPVEKSGGWGGGKKRSQKP